MSDADAFAPDDNFDAFSFDDIDPDKPGSGGGGGLPEGSYCFAITEITPKTDDHDPKVTVEVAAAEDTNLVGRTATEYLGWPRSDLGEVANRIRKEQLLAWCYAAKTTSPEIIKARQQARQGFDAAWLEAMVGKYVLAVVKKEKAYADKTTGEMKGGVYTKIDGRVWALDNPKGKGIPGWVDTGATATAPAATTPLPQQPPQEPPAGPDTFAGLV